MARFQRKRREVPAAVTTLARPLFRYSPGRDAYVLRVIGHQRGPVLKGPPSRRFRRD